MSTAREESVFLKLAEDLARGQKGILAMVVRSEGSAPRNVGACMWIRPDMSIEGTVGGGELEHRVMREAKAMFEEGRPESLMGMDLVEGASGMLCGGRVEVFLKTLGSSDELVVFGGGHVGRAVAKLGVFLGFDVVVWDDRPEFCDVSELGARGICSPLESFFEHHPPLSPRSYVVICTRGHAMDANVVEMLKDSNPAYIGMIGSRAKVAALREKLLERGVPKEHLDRIYQPIGLTIGAETPEEIALSIMAEIVAVRRGKDVSSLRKW